MRRDSLNGPSPILFTKLKLVQKLLSWPIPFPITLPMLPNGWQVLEPMARLEEDLARSEVRDADLVMST